MATITELTEKYISSCPSIKDCLRNNLVNYSKLARKIKQEVDFGKKTTNEAILIACRRYAEKIKKEKVEEKKIIDVLKKSQLEIKNKVAVVIVEKAIYFDNLKRIEKKVRDSADMFYAIESANVITIIVNDKYLEDISDVFRHKIIKITKNLAIITIKSPRDLENTPGVMSYLFSVFGENGINIVETMSCWTDTIFVVNDSDIGRIMNFLKF